MFETLAPYAGFGMKLLFGNMWLFKPLLKLVLPTVSAQAGAMLQTTVAFTMMPAMCSRRKRPFGRTCALSRTRAWTRASGS